MILSKYYLHIKLTWNIQIGSQFLYYLSSDIFVGRCNIWYLDCEIWIYVIFFWQLLVKTVSKNAFCYFLYFPYCAGLIILLFAKYRKIPLGKEDLTQEPTRHLITKISFHFQYGQAERLLQKDRRLKISRKFQDFLSGRRHIKHQKSLSKKFWNLGFVLFPAKSVYENLWPVRRTNFDSLLGRRQLSPWTINVVTLRVNVVVGRLMAFLIGPHALGWQQHQQATLQNDVRGSKLANLWTFLDFEHSCRSQIAIFIWFNSLFLRIIGYENLQTHVTFSSKGQNSLSSFSQLHFL